MQTLSAQNPDGKGPYGNDANKPTAEDPDQHNPPLKAPAENDGKRMDVHGAATNSEDGSRVQAAEGEIRATPLDP